MSLARAPSAKRSARGRLLLRGCGALAICLVLLDCGQSPLPPSSAAPASAQTTVPSFEASSPPSPPVAPPSPAPRIGAWHPVLDPALVSTRTVRGDYDSTAAVIHDVVRYRGRIVAVGSDPLGGTVWSSADGLTWRREPQDVDLDGVVLIRVVAGRDALVAIGETAFAGRRLFYSKDGVAWRPAPAKPFASRAYLVTVINALAYGRSGFVAVGQVNCGEGCEPGATVWTSRDGAVWARSGRIPPPSKTALLSLNSVVARSRGYLAFGSAIWRSTDGRRWTLQRRLPGSKLLDRVFRVRGDYLALHRGQQRTVLLRSVDGLSWQATAMPHGPGAAIDGIAPMANGLVAVGHRVASGPPNQTGDSQTFEAPVIWTSSDGQSWADASEGSSVTVGRLETAIDAGGRPLALGTRAQDLQSPGDPAVWTTGTNAGETPLPAPSTSTNTGTWEALPHFNLPRVPTGQEVTRAVSLFSHGAQVAIVYEQMSDTEGGDVTGIAWWSPATGAIQPGPTVRGVHEGAVVDQVDDQFVVLGGANTFGTARADLFDVPRAAWRHVSLAYELAYVTGALVGGRRILGIEIDAWRYRLIDATTLRSVAEGSVPFGNGAWKVFPTPDGRALVVTNTRAWVFDPINRTWRPAANAPRVGGLGPSAVLADGRAVFLRTQSSPDAHTWVDVIAADGSYWHEVETTPLSGIPIGLLAEPDGTLLVINGREQCDAEENCFPFAELTPNRGIGVVPP